MIYKIEYRKIKDAKTEQAKQAAILAIMNRLNCVFLKLNYLFDSLWNGGHLWLIGLAVQQRFIFLIDSSPGSSYVYEPPSAISKDDRLYDLRQIIEYNQLNPFG